MHATLDIKRELVLSLGTILVPLEGLSDDARSKLVEADADAAHVLMRRGGRAYSKALDDAAAGLVRCFSSPRRVADAIREVAALRGEAPEAIVDDAFALLHKLFRAGFVVHADDRGVATAPLALGSTFGPYRITGCVQQLEDTYVYAAEDADGRRVALKVTTERGADRVRTLFEREAAVLDRLGGEVAPALRGLGDVGGTAFLAMEWCDGWPSHLAAERLRARGASPRERVVACARIAEAYAALHERGVLHGDVHPRNVLVNDGGAVRLIDFGLARVPGSGADLPRQPGILEYQEPEYARAWLAGETLPASTALGEQYSLATLFYQLAVGRPYLDFELTRRRAIEQIASDPPIPFARRGAEGMLALERILVRAFAKEPSARFPDVTSMAAELRACTREPNRASSTRVAEAHPALAAFVRRYDLDAPLLRTGLATVPRTSITFGSAGVAWALLRLAELRSDPHLVACADSWTLRARRESSTLDDAFSKEDLDLPQWIESTGTPYHGPAGVFTVEAMVARARGDLLSCSEAVAELVRVTDVTPDCRDLTLGQAGALVACALLLERTKGEFFEAVQATLRGHGAKIADRLHSWMATLADVGRCPELTSLGIAHGWAGILHALLLWSNAAGSPVGVDVERRLEQLADCGVAEGDGTVWPLKRGPDEEQKSRSLVGSWCNGSAGYVQLWLQAYRAGGSPRHLDLAERAGRSTARAREGGANVCCGSAGRGYALAALHRITGDAGWLRDARELCDEALGATWSLEDSLYKGRLGAVLLAAELESPASVEAPFF